jgi:uncharacterized membrane protein
MPEIKQITLHLFAQIKRLDAKHRLYTALGIALLVLLLTSNFVAFPINFMITWLTYSGCTLLFAWITILYSHPLDVSKIAPKNDSSRTLVFIFVVGAAFVSLLAVIVLLQSTAGLSKEAARLHILLSITCVAFAWFLVHTIFTLRYAHYYYSGAQLGLLQKYGLPGGLDFPGEPKPDYLDFAYFSFVIGMTFQVSDVEIKSKKIRRLALLHALISFAFNTVIVALVINVILGVVEK